MALELAGLLVANVAYAVVGAAAFVAGGWVRVDDPRTWKRLGAAYLFGLAVLVLVVVALFAITGPARRASKIDPVSAVRAE